ncbi:RsmE family RNA methyltransferase [Cohnella nanjingensis]|uniref:Ribosomal RNA small subunit methyltransferase E n=1 Tax=Cohnella nanjingensis TaxID=1387779 RepID=A0A7X0VK42_9BACL|nr:RsmE family RNA methyltransferase [Cohnella nanjingensis]MBB6675384.1 16S rRNA (uracil(1498)-N(3))-methyltransferase [Cohnella nanjingensis]
MQRYFVTPARLSEREVTLEGDDARHLATVMRAKAGEAFIACDGEGRECVAEVAAIEPGRVVGRIVERRASESEMAWRVTVAQSLPKGDKFETVIQKGTEAGAAAFLPFLSRRTVVQYDERKEAKRLERWRKIAKEAAEQAHRGKLPEVGGVMTWKALLASFPDYDQVWLCYEEEGRRGEGLRPALLRFRQSLGADAQPRVLLVVGPEGGFAPQEAEQAQAAGAACVGLGRRILRTETAALVALAAIGYESGEMGG